MSSHSVRRINEIIDMTGAKRYLEIGVATGVTFQGVNAVFKDGVDPNFRFDVVEVATENHRLFAMTSDAFFGSARPHRTYDVIFLDGLHTFEQTFRDLLASLLHAHAGTVWLIDDTLPTDVFSAQRDFRFAVRKRKEAGLKGGHWHGDTFKVVLALHDFFPNMSFRTITTGGNSQTVAWLAPRQGFAPSFDDLEAISRLTFFDLENLKNEFNFCSEKEALDALRAHRGESVGTLAEV